MSPPCRHFEVCHLPATQAHGGDEYCYLHWPQREGKNLEVFNQLLRGVLRPENSDFRFIQFPAGLGGPNDFAGRRFVGPADFSDVAFHGPLNLTGTVFEQGLRITGQHMGPVLLDGAKITPGVYIFRSQGTST